MSDFRDQLIDLYGRHSVAKVTTLPEYVKLCTENEEKENKQFRRERDLIEKAKKELEDKLDSQSRKTQVVEALKEIRQQRLAGKDELYLALVLKGYEPSWTEPQRMLFADACKLITLKHHFFLSFTMRHPPPPEFNPLNRKYMPFILDTLTNKKVESLGDGENLLAHAVNTLLIERPRDSFFFKEKQYNNEETIPKLEEGLKNSLFFVQLVQNIMVVAPEDQTNYSFFEFNQAVAVIPKSRILFVVAERNRKSLFKMDEVHPDYRDWHKMVDRKDVPYLGHVDDVGPDQGKLLRALLQKEIGDPIDSFWEELYKSVPD